MNWLAQIDGDAMLSEDSRRLAKIMIEDFRADVGDYINGHDAEFAEIMNRPMRVVAEARRELIMRGHLIPLNGRMNTPSFRLSTCRW